MCKTCNDRIITNALRVFDCKNRSCISLYENYAPLISEHISQDDQNHFNDVLKLLEDLKFIKRQKSCKIESCFNFLEGCQSDLFIRANLALMKLS